MLKWVKKEDNGLPIRSWCDPIEDGALEQAKNLAKHPAIVKHIALMPDCHEGYGMPIGGVIAVKDAVIPNAVGVDIGCGMIAVETDIDADRLSDMAFRRKIQEEVKKRIPVGEGNRHQTGRDWEGFDVYRDGGGVFVQPIDMMNLGTLGGGNHFIEIQKSDDNKVWLMIHSGSRNLGKRIADFYHQKALKLNEMFHSMLPDKDLAFLPVNIQEGQDYLKDMNFSLSYAMENRQRMMKELKEAVQQFIPDVNFIREINIHHNYAALENHFGENLWIHRKGATSAKLDEIGIIPGSMGTASYIVKGLGNPLSFMSCSHGAGRRMSRKAACETLTIEDCDAAMSGIVCERWHKSRRYSKGSAEDVMDLSEAPQAYKQIEDVIAAEDDLVQPIVHLMPLASLKG